MQRLKQEGAMSVIKYHKIKYLKPLPLGAVALAMAIGCGSQDSNVGQSERLLAQVQTENAAGEVVNTSCVLPKIDGSDPASLERLIEALVRCVQHDCENIGPPEPIAPPVDTAPCGLPVYDPEGLINADERKGLTDRIYACENEDIPLPPEWIDPPCVIEADALAGLNDPENAGYGSVRASVAAAYENCLAPELPPFDVPCTDDHPDFIAPPDDFEPNVEGYEPGETNGHYNGTGCSENRGPCGGYPGDDRFGQERPPVEPGECVKLNGAEICVPEHPDVNLPEVTRDEQTGCIVVNGEHLCPPPPPNRGQRGTKRDNENGQRDNNNGQRDNNNGQRDNNNPDANK